MIEGLTAELTLPIEQVSGHRVSPAVLSLSDDGAIGIKAVDENAMVVFHPVEILGGTEDSIWVGGLPDSLDHDRGRPGIRPGRPNRSSRFPSTTSQSGAVPSRERADRRRHQPVAHGHRDACCCC